MSAPRGQEPGQNPFCTGTSHLDLFIARNECEPHIYIPLNSNYMYLNSTLHLTAFQKMPAASPMLPDQDGKVNKVGDVSVERAMSRN